MDFFTSSSWSPSTRMLRRACPQGAGGYGGYYQMNLGDEEAIGLGGVELIRAAMRKAAKQLRWKVTNHRVDRHPQRHRDRRPGHT
jgi:hypothetical protein